MRAAERHDAEPCNAPSSKDLRAETDQLGLQVAEREALIKLMKGTFAVHGAVPMASSAIGFRPSDMAPDAACLLDRSGAVLALRHELRAPFAAWLARQVRPGSTKNMLPIGRSTKVPLSPTFLSQPVCQAELFTGTSVE